MDTLIRQYNRIKAKVHVLRGFVLPYTLFVSTIMILITSSVSIILTKQLFFSKLARQSQAAYYAADNAIACAIAIDGTYYDPYNATGTGIFPYIVPVHAGATLSQSPDIINIIDNMQSLLDNLTAVRAGQGARPLAAYLHEITCAQSNIFDTDPPTSFTVSPVIFIHHAQSGDEEGLTSTFNMRMDTGDGNYRCAKVTVNKTETYRQIIAQGYALCDRPEGTVERAVINTTAAP